VRPFGVRVATVRTIAERALAALEPRDVERVWRLCDALGCSGWLEESYVAGYWAQAMADAYRPADVHVFGRWLDSWVDNWATCDALCCESVGRLLESAPQVASTVAAWAASPNRWVRRGAAEADPEAGGTVIIGSGLRRSKIALPGSLLAAMPGVEVVEGLALA
jgi:3-methyladenine DNA glycosylase AlkD